MELLFLGTGAGSPAKTRNVSSLALKLLDEINEVWLFDCGEATQHQILNTTLKPRKIRNIFITHLHGDHIFGLAGLLSSRSFQGGEDKLTLYGPVGIKQYILTSLKISKTHLQYKLEIIELDSKGGKIMLDKGWRVDYLPLNHNILSFGYRITEPDSKGKLLMDKLKAFNIPNGPLLGKLKNGEKITLEDGREVDGKDYIAPDVKGRVVTILGDTRPCNNSTLLARDADVLVHEATHTLSEKEMAHQYFHSTSFQAAQTAKEAQVKSLYLNHISSRYVGPLARAIEEEAREIFPNTILSHDLMEYKIDFE